MKIIISIFRWMMGLSFGMLLFLLVLLIVPISIAGQQLFERESGMAWLTTLTSDKVSVAKLIDASLEGLATSSSIDDPMLKQASKLAADKNSPFGSAVRKVLNPTSVGENLLANATVFYQWLDGDSTELPFVYKVGGTSAEQVGLVSAFMQLRYKELPQCTTAELKKLGKIDENVVLELPCSVGAISGSTFDKAAKKLLGTPEAREILSKGITSKATVTQQQREGVLTLKKSLGNGVVLAWIIIAVFSLFMILLYTPVGVNFIATGLTVGMTGLSVVFFGQLLGTFGEVFRRTLGTLISTQGMYIGIAGAILVIIGIWQLFKKKEDVPVVVQKKESTIAKVVVSSDASSKKTAAV